MHKKIITLLVLFLFFNINAQTDIDTTKVPFVAYWSIGDSYDFRITKIKTRWKNDVLSKKDSSQYIANFKVLDSTATSYTISWTYTDKIISSLSKTIKEKYGSQQNLDSIISKNMLTNIIYTTDELGEFIEVENWQQISDLMSGLFTQIKATLKKNKPENYDKVEQVLNPLIEAYSSKSGIEQLVLSELQYLHYPFGLEYDISEPIEYEQEFPNLFGGKPLKGDATLSFESVDFEDSFCVLVEESKVRQKDTKALIQLFLKKAGFSKKKTKKVLKDAVIDIRDKNIYEYYYYPGVPHKITTLRKTLVKMEENTNRDETLMMLELIYDVEE